MNLTLSWDLFALVFIALVVTYTLIIGKKASLTIIIATYIAIVSVQGVGNILQRVLTLAGPYLAYVGLAPDPVLISTIKLILFVAILITLAVRGGIDVKYAKEPHPIVNTALTALCGLATAGLVLSTLFTYTSGVPLLDMHMAGSASLSAIVQQSRILQMLILNQDVFFFIPALVLLIAGWLGNR